MDENKYIKDNYLKIPLKRIAANLGRSYTFVSGRMKKMNISVPKELSEERKRKGMYRKGQTAFNKGKKQSEWMSSEAIERTSKSRFKKGQLPHNTRQDFAISKRHDEGRYYYYIRLGLSNWVLLHRYIWELHNGKIPKGVNIQFKDGDSTNCRIENLFSVSREHQVRVNKKGGSKLPFEIQETQILISKINHKIKQYEELDN